MYCRQTFALICMAALSACSSVNTQYELANAPSTLRLIDGVEVQNPPRFRLPPQAGINLIAAEQVPQPWLIHAQKGLQRVFSDRTQPGYQLQVAWPQFDDQTHRQVHRSLKVGAFGVLEMPSIPPRQNIGIKLLDRNGILLADMDLLISPAWWGKAWSEPEYLEASFSHLAEVLVGR